MSKRLEIDLRATVPDDLFVQADVLNKVRPEVDALTKKLTAVLEEASLDSAVAVDVRVVTPAARTKPAAPKKPKTTPPAAAGHDKAT